MADLNKLDATALVAALRKPMLVIGTEEFVATSVPSVVEVHEASLHVDELRAAGASDFEVVQFYGEVFTRHGLPGDRLKEFPAVVAFQLFVHFCSASWDNLRTPAPTGGNDSPPAASGA